MTLPFPTFLVTLAALISFGSAATVSYYEISVTPFPDSKIGIDLDRDGADDILVDFGLILLGGHDTPYELSPLGSSLIATSDGIATSFSIGDSVNLGLLSFVDSSGSTLAGGAAYDLLGNFVAEGWGFQVDPQGNPIPPPENFVDLFVVDLESGVAWVDFGPPNSFLQFPIRWGLSDSDDPFMIDAIPEPSVVALILPALAAASWKRNRRTRRGWTTRYPAASRILNPD